MLIAAIVLVATPLVARGQSSRDSTTLQRFLTARERARVAQVELKAFERPRPRTELKDGNLTIYFNMNEVSRDDSVALARTLHEASATLSNRYGTALREWIGAPAFIVRSGIDAQTQQRRVEIRWQSGGGADDSWESQRRDLRVFAYQYIMETASRLTQSRSDSLGLAWWRRPWGHVTDAGFTEIATFLGRSPSSVARRCLTANTEACAAILQIDGPTNTRLTLYSEDDYPTLVEMSGVKWPPESPRGPIAQRCIRQKEIASCASAIQWVAIPAAVPQDVLNSFAGLTLEMGGPDAFTRLATAHGTIREQLAFVAGVPADSVVRTWQRRVMASRPVSPIANTTLATIGWLAALSLVIRRRPRCA
jgi:hypothetical protein